MRDLRLLGIRQAFRLGFASFFLVLFEKPGSVLRSQPGLCRNGFLSDDAFFLSSRGYDFLSRRGWRFGCVHRCIFNIVGLVVSNGYVDDLK